MYRTYCLASSTLENEVSAIVWIHLIVSDWGTKAKREKVPNIAYFGFQKNYEEPSLEEGFSEIVDVRWYFEGSEEERKRWNMLHQSINGK